MKNQAAEDPVMVALDALRRGGDELAAARRREEVARDGLNGNVSRNSAAHREWEAAARDVERLKAQQQDRDLATKLALASQAHRGARFHPTSFLSQFAEWREASPRAMKGGHPDKSPIFTLVTAADFRNATVTTTSYPEQVFRTPGAEPYPQPPLNIVDLINWIPTDSEMPQFMYEFSESSVATETEEASAAPESAMSWTPMTTYCKRLPVWIPASRAVLDDIPTLENLLSTRLMVLLKERLQTQVLVGSGTFGSADAGDNLCGIANTPNTLTVAVATVGNPLQPRLDAIVNAVEAIRHATATMYDPSLLLMDDAVAATLSELKDDVGRPIFPPNEPLAPFGLRTIVNDSVSAGSPMVGAPESLDGFVRGDVLTQISDVSFRLLRTRSAGPVPRRSFRPRRSAATAWCQITGF